MSIELITLTIPIRFMTDEYFLPPMCHTSKSQSSFLYNGIKLRIATG